MVTSDREAWSVRSRVTVRRRRRNVRRGAEAVLTGTALTAGCLLFGMAYSWLLGGGPDGDAVGGAVMWLRGASLALVMLACGACGFAWGLARRAR